MTIRTTTITTITCDRHQEDVPAVATRSLVIDGKRWTLDLCGPCLLSFEGFASSFTDHARKPRKRTPETRAEGIALRAWWREHQGEFPAHPYQHRGRIPDVVASEHEARKRAAA